ncbi:MAG: hypothetical protein R3Y36_03810 [Spirochaetales bacterium]
MKPNIKKLLHKEVKELLSSYLTIIGIIVSIIISYFESARSHNINDIFTIGLTGLTVGQYVYDSYLSDVKDQGALFLHNIKIGFFESFIVKTCFALSISIIILCTNIPNLIGYVGLADIPWIIGYIVFATIIMQIASIYAKGAEITAGIIAIAVQISVFFLLYQTDNALLKALIITAFDAIALRLCFKLFHSLNYRTQL